MSEKPARRVDTRDGSATELSITTKFFFDEVEALREKESSSASIKVT